MFTDFAIKQHSDLMTCFILLYLIKLDVCSDIDKYCFSLPLLDNDQFGNKSNSFDLFSLNDPFKVST